ncbi:hypothetical protein E3N88_44396 [Mikania micrantha]|uniref:DUF740 domain-containing protein n=1 Tax=Mikania micrantha TaxID=192012 RepID=A0A5N6LEI5_9ASTR|nr:hypothetical protein E3N88_44396 [Mikania micrantha]
MDLDSRIRTGNRTRRRSACYRHPNEPVVGLCALCLRDRLAGLDSSRNQLHVKHETIVSFPLSRRTRGHAGASSSGVALELRRSKSVAVEKCEIVDLSFDLRRKSCDVRASNRLTDLFDIDDTKTGGDGVVKVESKNLGFSGIVEPVLEINEDYDNCSEIRVSNDLIRNEVEDNGGIGEEEDLRTMKEHIEMELQNRKKNFWEAASVFSRKLQKWRQKHKGKKQNEVCNGRSDNNRSSFSGFKDSQFQSDVADHGLGRRSCDAAPRFLVDAHRVSVDDPRCSFDEHRASWDGYMIARTIPRLTPMLPIVDDMIFPPVNKRITVKEDVLSSGASAKSNSDSSSSNTGSSSSSMKSSSSKTVGLECNYMKSVSQRNDSQETKLVITERELNDWHLSSVNRINLESTSNAPISARRTVKNGWRKVSNLWSYKSKLVDKKNDSYINNNRPSLNQNNEINGFTRGNSSGKLVRNSSYVGSRNRTESHPNGQEGARHSVSDIESGLMRLHFSPFVGKSGNKLATSTATDG